jgi:hypothetical protein
VLPHGKADRRRFLGLVLGPDGGSADDLAECTAEAEAGDYPEGRYELALQTAVESNNQPEVDALLARRSRAQMIWLAIILLAGFLVASFIVGPPAGPREGGPDGQQKPPAVKDKQKQKDAGPKEGGR